MWFYRDGTGRPLERLVVAKLDDPEGVATRHFNLDWGVVGNNYAYAQRGYGLCDVTFLAHNQVFKFRSSHRGRLLTI